MADGFVLDASVTIRWALQDGSAADRAYADLGKLPIELDVVAPSGIQLAVASVSREFSLSGYDAQYLELARRLSIPIATLDKDLRKAAKRAGVPIYLVH